MTLVSHEWVQAHRFDVSVVSPGEVGDPDTSPVSNRTVVLFSGDGDNLLAAHAFWRMKLHGRDNVRLLGGGRWTLPVDGRLRESRGLSLKPYRAFRADVSSGGVSVVDVRTPQEFAEGHIPGAVNIPLSETVNADGTFKPAPALERLFDGLLDRPVIVYCRSGVRAAHTWFALHEIVGVQDVRNYDGSWLDYTS
ncbi:sulfurtransferase [Allorhizocola rhizosphaerae]|uniref:sulfurtransferase n=1 Tax=Allorhizocola rhizosphaerae TaxID=1872709 RepID=UPI000E3DEACB|nr:rhodanese-like domain-containing protein [Allorhizocola rhizosphaerae]